MRRRISLIFWWTSSFSSYTTAAFQKVATFHWHRNLFYFILFFAMAEHYHPFCFLLAHQKEKVSKDKVQRVKRFDCGCVGNIQRLISRLLTMLVSTTNRCTGFSYYKDRVQRMSASIWLCGSSYSRILPHSVLHVLHLQFSQGKKFVNMSRKKGES